MNKIKSILLVGISTLFVLSACGNEEKAEDKKQTIHKPNTEQTSKQESVIKKMVKSPEIEESEELVANYLLAFNEKSKEDFGAKIEGLFVDGYSIHYKEDFDYGQLREVEVVKFTNSEVKNDNNKEKLFTTMTYDFVDVEGTPRQHSSYVVANFSLDSNERKLTDVYFYEDKEDYEKPSYYLHTLITKNSPIVLYGDSLYKGNLDIDAMVEPTNNLDETLATLARQSILKYEALYLETNTEEYNRKVKNLYHSSVIDGYLVNEANEFINGNQIKMIVNSIELEFVNRTSDGGFTYEGNYSLIYYDKNGGETVSNQIYQATFQPDGDNGIRLVSISY